MTARAFFSALGVVALALSTAAANRASFLVDETRISAGSSHVIPFSLAPAPLSNLTLQVDIQPRGSVALLEPAVVLAGQTTGYLQVRAPHPGRATIRAGGAKIAVEVVPADTRSALGVRPPEFIAPAPGAAVWGTFAAGVEWFGPPADTAGGEMVVAVKGRDVAPVRVLPADGSLHRRFVFEFNADLWPEGGVRLTPKARRADGGWIAGTPLELQVYRAQRLAILRGECESMPPLAGPRPERYGTNLPPVEKQATASGGAFVMNNAGRPAVLLPINVSTTATYQLMLTARGTLAGGALPTVALQTDQGTRPVARGRLVDTEWRRTPIGRPATITQGVQVVAFEYDNDFYEAQTGDRDLSLDGYELARLPPRIRPGDAGGAAMAGETMMAGTMMDRMTASDGGAAAASELQVTWNSMVDGRSLAGPVPLSAQVTGPEDALREVSCHLVVNGRVVDTQFGPAPRFLLLPAQLQPGTHLLLVRAQAPDGGKAETRAVQVAKPSAVAGGADPGLPARRFTVYDPAWGGALLPNIDGGGEGKPAELALWFINAAAALRLPDHLEGEREVALESRGTLFKGPPVLDVDLVAGGVTTRVGQARPDGQLRELRIGAVKLPGGDQRLVVSFTNDLCEGENKDRNVWLRALTLRPPLSAGPAPRVALAYPGRGQVARDADALVVEWSAASVPCTMQALADGRPLGVAEDIDACFTPAVIPVSLRGLPPGRHALAVCLRDAAGQSVTSQTVIVRVDPGARELTRYERALVLLERFAYGPEPAELAEVLMRGEAAWLADRLAATADTPGEQSVTARARQLMPDDYNADQVTRRSLYEAVASPNPVRTRFVLWTENHFSTWIQKTGPYPKAREHAEFRRLGVAPFRDLLFASASSPAMLIYLDQTRSFARKMNENYAREIMELHCLGVDGGYTQKDVTELARLLTGWMASEEARPDGDPRDRDRPFRFDPLLNSTDTVAVVGRVFPACDSAHRYDRIRLGLDTLAAHPSTARFVCRSLAEHYVASPPPEPLVADLAAVYHRTGGDLRDVLKAMAAHPAFWPAAREPRPASPQDYAIRAARLTGFDNTGALNGFMRRSGMGLYDRATPDGYPDTDEAFNDSNVVLQRWRFARDLREPLGRLVPASARQPAMKEDWGPWQDDVLDHVALRLTGRPVSSSSRDAAREVLAGLPGEAWVRLALMTTFVAQSPEAAER